MFLCYGGLLLVGYLGAYVPGVGLGGSGEWVSVVGDCQRFFKKKRKKKKYSSSGRRSILI